MGRGGRSDPSHAERHGKGALIVLRGLGGLGGPAPSTLHRGPIQAGLRGESRGPKRASVARRERNPAPHLERLRVGIAAAHLCVARLPTCRACHSASMDARGWRTRCAQQVLAGQLGGRVPARGGGLSGSVAKIASWRGKKNRPRYTIVAPRP